MDKKISEVKALVERIPCSCVWVCEHPGRSEVLIPCFGGRPGEGWERVKCHRCQAIEVLHG